GARAAGVPSGGCPDSPENRPRGMTNGPRPCPVPWQVGRPPSAEGGTVRRLIRWGTAMRPMLQRLRDHRGKVLAALLFPAWAVFFWWLLPPQPRLSLTGTEDDCLAGFSADGASLVTVARNPEYGKKPVDWHSALYAGPVRVWDVATGQPRF